MIRQVPVIFYPGWMRVGIPAGRGFMIGTVLASMLVGTVTVANINFFLLGAAVLLTTVNGRRRFREHVHAEALRRGINPSDLRIM